jgi:hypothetical protein
MEDLHIKTEQGWLPTDVLRFEELDYIITNAMHDAERKCRKLNMGATKWSPLYQRACDKVTYWKLVKKQYEGKRSNARKILSLQKKLRLTVQCTSLPEAEDNLLRAIKEWKKCKKYAPELQMEYRHQLAKAKEEEDNIPAATHIRNLTKQEDTRALFRRIRYLEQKVANLSTSRISVTTSTGVEKEFTRKDQIEHLIIRSNEKKYHQTEGHGQLQHGRLLADVGIMHGNRARNRCHFTGSI